MDGCGPDWRPPDVDFSSGCSGWSWRPPSPRRWPWPSIGAPTLRPGRTRRTSSARCCWCLATADRRARWNRSPTFCMGRAGPPIVVSLPGDGTGDLDQQADGAGAGRRLRPIAARARRPSTSSATRPAAWSPGCGCATTAAPPSARRIVTLGSPQHGTDLAGLAGVPAPGALPDRLPAAGAPDSPLLDRLNTGDETPTGPTFVSIWTTDDKTVLPPDSARLAGALNVTVQSVCASAPRRVTATCRPTRWWCRSCRAELAAGQPVPADPADCGRLSS